jgi:hypothetical protein
MKVPSEDFCGIGLRMMSGRRDNLTKQVNYAARVAAAHTVVADVSTVVRAVRWATGGAALKKVCR